jgi:hypothetical protein|tara:strand:+ start:83 stop:580 length:498 start_codon:yes stop_codon:yes gene_type:complete
MSRFCYYWSNSRVTLGVGTSSGTSDNTRVNKEMTKKALKTKKDAGKTVIASFVARQTGESLKLNMVADTTEKVSGNATSMEREMKQTVTKGKFIVYDGVAMSKVDFMDNVFLKVVEEKFGANSLEFNMTQMAAGDGDMWGRFSRNKTFSQAFDNIITKVLHTEDR